MKKAIDAQPRSSGEKFVSLREEALRDMAIFMTETGRVDEAIQYFQATVGDKEFYPKVIERLAKQYERNVEPAKAALVYESLMKARSGQPGPSGDEETFRVLVKLVDLDLRRERFRGALVRIHVRQV